MTNTTKETLEEFKAGQLVQHKLTGETFLVLDYTGYGATSIPQTRVRRKDLTELFLDTDELEERVL